MCHNCNNVGQRTFGAIVGLDPVVPVAPIEPEIAEDAKLVDPVKCVDDDKFHERDDCTQDAHGAYYFDADNLSTCPHCDELFDTSELDDNDGYCENCRQRHYSECNSCGNVISNNDRTISEGGDDYCQRCYCDAFTSCDDCSCEVAMDEVRCNDNGSYCESCYSSHDNEGEHDAPRFRGKMKYDELRSQRKYGVELETSCSDGWSSWIENTAFGAKDDGSVNGKEFVSPVLYGDDGLDACRNLCKYADNHDCTVDRSCGYHLHCDLSGTSAEQRKSIALAYAYTKDFWAGCVHERRRNNSYCHDNVQGGRVYWDVDSIKAGDDYPDVSTRYVWINWNAYGAHNTVEVRSHEGTLDGNAVCNWIKAHLRFIDAVANMTPGQITRKFGNKTIKTQFRNMRDIWMDDELSTYYGRKAGIEETQNAECAA